MLSPDEALYGSSKLGLTTAGYSLGWASPALDIEGHHDWDSSLPPFHCRHGLRESGRGGRGPLGCFFNLLFQDHDSPLTPCAIMPATSSASSTLSFQLG